MEIVTFFEGLQVEEFNIFSMTMHQHTKQKLIIIQNYQ